MTSKEIAQELGYKGDPAELIGAINEIVEEATEPMPTIEEMLNKGMIVVHDDCVEVYYEDGSWCGGEYLENE